MFYDGYPAKGLCPGHRQFGPRGISHGGHAASGFNFVLPYAAPSPAPSDAPKFSLTGRPVQFEITEQTRFAIRDWLSEIELRDGRFLFPSRFRAQPHLSTRQYARIVHAWVESAGLDSSAYGTHSMRRTKVAQIYRKTGNLRAVQLLLGHTKLESTVRYLGIEVDDALSIAEQVEL
jgi:integrase